MEVLSRVTRRGWCERRSPLFFRWVDLDILVPIWWKSLENTVELVILPRSSFSVKSFYKIKLVEMVLRFIIWNMLPVHKFRNNNAFTRVASSCPMSSSLLRMKWQYRKRGSPSRSCNCLIKHCLYVLPLAVSNTILLGQRPLVISVLKIPYIPLHYSARNPLKGSIRWTEY
jgi:hypothetical protein